MVSQKGQDCHAKSVSVEALVARCFALHPSSIIGRPCRAQSGCLRPVRVCEKGDRWYLAGNGPPAEWRLWGAAADSELVRNAAQWIAAFVQRRTQVPLAIIRHDTTAARRRRLIAAFGAAARAALPGLFEAGQPVPDVGSEGFVIRRVFSSQGGDSIVCWSPSERGCRYGLINVLRSLESRGKTVTSDLVHVVDRPRFPMRICYVNFAEHLRMPSIRTCCSTWRANRWSRADWERFIDMLSAFRYNIFEFWLVPTLFSPEAARGQDPARIRRNDQPRNRLRQTARSGGTPDPGRQHGRLGVALPLPQ